MTLGSVLTILRASNGGTAMERLGDIVARVLAGVRDTMDGEKAGSREGPRQVAARREEGGFARVNAHNDTPAARSQKRAAPRNIGVMRR